MLNNAGKDESVELAGIREIKVIKKSRAQKGGLYGFLAGAAVGAVLSLATDPDNSVGGALEAAMYAAMLGIPSGLIGLGVGALTSADRPFRFEGASESDRAGAFEAIAYLRDKARVRD